MKKSIAAAISAVLLLCLASCNVKITTIETTEAVNTASVIDDVTAVITESTTTVQTEINTETETEETLTEAETEAAVTTTVQETVSVTEVDLDITLPEANGKMVVDRSPSNRFTAAIASQKKIDTDLLVAVYSVPESGQNYVFEFYTNDKHSKDNIRRVYLLDSNCKITGVAASSASERENLSTTENWFCMTVLIKGVIFPEIEEQF